MKSGEGFNILHYKVCNHYKHWGSHRSTMHLSVNLPTKSNDVKVASRHRFHRPTMSSTDRSVLLGRGGSSSSLRRATWTARPDGM